MGSAEIEKLQFDVESSLYHTSESHILKIIEAIEITADLSNKSKRQKITILRKAIEDKLDEESIENTEKIALLQNVLSIIRDTPPPLDDPVVNELQEQTMNQLKKQHEELMKKQQSEMNELLTKMEELRKSPGIRGDKNNTISGMGITAQSLLRREFKIAGQIGEPGQTDKLSFVSLTHQIDSALKRGYEELEIVDAIIRSISPHSSLRSYVETLHDLSLAKLRKILRVHYREKTASELYQLLATACQTPKETAQQFLLRSLDLRNKVIFASQEADCEVSYDTQLLQKTFQKAFETGLKDDILAANLRPTLRTPNLRDEDLMSQVNELAASQAERHNKLSSEKSRNAKVNSCTSEARPPATPSKSGADNELLAAIREIKGELSDLRGKVDATEGGRPPIARGRGSYRGVGHRGRRNGSTGRKRGCASCQEKNVGEECRHCYSCGGQFHLAYQCPSKNNNSGNERRLQPGGRE